MLVFEGMVIFFATLVALDLSDVERRTLWWVGRRRRPCCASCWPGCCAGRWAFVAGSVLQVALVAAGFVVPAMFFLGVVFAGLWFFALVPRPQGRAAMQAAPAPAAPRAGLE